LHAIYAVTDHQRCLKAVRLPRRKTERFVRNHCKNEVDVNRCHSLQWTYERFDILADDF